MITKILSLILWTKRFVPFTRIYIFWLKTLFAINPFLLLNVPRLAIYLAKDITLPNVGARADYLLAATAKDAEFMRRHCPHAKSIRVVGSPRFDNVLSSSPIDSLKVKVDIQQLFHIPEGKKIILFLSSAQVEHGLMSPNDKTAINSAILECFARFQDQVHLIIKLHPAEKNIFPLIWKKYYDEFISITYYDLNKLIYGSDLVLAWFSTTIINSVLARKPIVVLDLFEISIPVSPQLILYVLEEGAALRVSNIRELSSALDNLMRKKTLAEKLVRSSDRFCSKYLSMFDGKSSKRIAKILYELAGCS